jgi:hypothetical protein
MKIREAASFVQGVESMAGDEIKDHAFLNALP